MEVPPGPHRHRSRTRNKIELPEEIQIVHQVLCQMKPLRQVAKEHRVTIGCISNIVKRVRGNSNHLRDRLAEVAVADKKKEDVSSALADMYKRNEYLGSVKYIQ